MLGYSYRSSLYVLLLFALVGFAIYANSLDVPFYLDDIRNISENNRVKIDTISFSSLSGAAFEGPIKTRPLALISFALNYYFHQSDVFGYHLVNILFHVLTCFILYLLFRITLTTPALNQKYSNKTTIAFLGALLFLVHPLHTGSVTYIVQRMVLMASLFYVVSLLCYVHGRIASAKASRTAWIWFAGSFISFLLAMGSKEIAATLPFVIFIYEWYLFRNLDRRWLYRHLWIVALLLSGLVCLFLYMGGSQAVIESGYVKRPFTLVERLLTQFRVVAFYLGLLLFPRPERLNLDHYFSVSQSLFDPVTTFFAAMLLLLLLMVSFAAARKQRVFSFAILWFLGNLVIESSVIGLELVFEHRTYLPSMFLFFSFVLLLFQYMGPRPVVYAVLIILVSLWSYWTVQRNEVWRDPVAFWSDSARKSPEKARPYMNLSVALRESGDIDGAIAASKRAIEIDPRFVNGFVGLAAAYEEKGELEKAAALYRHVLQLMPKYAEVHNMLGVVYLKQGKVFDAIMSFNESLRVKPDNVNTLVNRATAKAYLGNFAEAVADYNRALKLEGSNPNILFNLAVTYRNSGQTEMAIATFEKLLRMNPKDIEARKFLEAIRSQSK